MREKLIKSEVIKLFKTTKETLRYYEKAGLLTPEVDEKNYRYYDFRDLEKLRQIFFLRDIELSIDEMQKIERNQISKDEYLSLLVSHEEALKAKIKHLSGVMSNISQLIDLEKDDTSDVTFCVNEKDERHMLICESLNSSTYDSPKEYYDKYSSLINQDHYSERTFQMIFAFEDLGSGEKIDSKQCVELPIIPDELRYESDTYFDLQSGQYLSIYYTFEEGKFEGLPRLKIRIENYMKAHDLEMIGKDVLEIEHPELSLFERETSTVFELQINVRKRCQ